MTYESGQCDDAEVEVVEVFRKLPQDVIDYIVSFLSLKDFVKMSIVSKSWRYRWKTCRNLDFDVHCLYPEEETNISPMSKPKQLQYLNWVNQILSAHQGDSIEFFRIRFYLLSKHKAYVDQWIKSALQKEVRNLVIHDMPRYEVELSQVSRKYTLPSWFSIKDAMSMNHLTLGNICLGSFEVSCSNNLTSLTLSNVFISDIWVHTMLQNSIHLKRLSLHGCTSLSLTKLVIPSHIKLEHLSLLNGLVYLCQVEIEDGKSLESFECSLKIFKSFRFDKVRNVKKLSLLMDSSMRSFGTLEDIVAQVGRDIPRLEVFSLHCGDV